MNARDFEGQPASWIAEFTSVTIYRQRRERANNIREDIGRPSDAC